MIALVAAAASAQMTADEIISKHIAATGGEKVMRDVSTIMVKGSMFMQGMPMDLEWYIKRPDKSFMQVSSNNMVLGGGGTDGTNAWASQMGQSFILEGDQKQSTMQQADRFPLLDYKTKGATVSFAGEDLVKGAKTYKVEYVSKANDTTVYYFDATTFYIVKEKESSGSATFSGHKAVNGIVFPFKINSTIEAQGQSMQQMITIDSIAVNAPVADSLFIMPKNAQPMPKMPEAPPAGQTGDGK
jgi:hypothetical protein